jgi:hypothetical protein
MLSLKQWADNFFHKKGVLKPLIIFSLVSLTSIYFLLPGFFSEIILPDNGDNNIAIGIMMHNMKVMSQLSFSDVYHFPIFYPYSYTLTAGVNFIGQSVVLLPFYLIGIKNVYFLYNWLLFVSLVLGGIAAYFLIKEFVDQEILCLTGGAVYILLPLRQINFPHPHLLFFFFSIFSFLFLIRYVKDFKRKDALLFYLFLFLQALFSITLFFLTSIFSAFLFLIFIIIKRKLTFKVLVELTIGLVLLGIFIFFIFTPYITNPLNISYEKGEFTKKTLLRSWDFYSTWFPLTFKFLRGWSTPLFLGFAASFFIFFYFNSKTKFRSEKIGTFTLLFLLTLPVLLTFFKGIPLRSIKEVIDLLFISTIVIFLINVVMVWKRTVLGEKFVLISLVFVFLSCFRGLFEYIPLKTNFFYLISLVIPRLTRLRGFKFKYYFIVFWILLVFLGFRAFMKQRKKTPVNFVAVWILVFLLFFENFPPPLTTGRQREHNDSEKILYNKIEKYPDHYGVLELPHFRGFGDNKIFSLYTIYHDKHIYNGFYGVGIFDPLEIFKRQYFYPNSKIPDDINNEAVLNYLRDNGIRIILFHKSLIIFGSISGEKRAKIIKDANRLWANLDKGFREAEEKGLLSELDILNNGIIAVIKEQKKGKTFSYQFPYYTMKSKRFLLIGIRRISEDPVEITIELNGELLFKEVIMESCGDIMLKISEVNRLKARGNKVEIKCSDEVCVNRVELIK